MLENTYNHEQSDNYNQSTEWDVLKDVPFPGSNTEQVTEDKTRQRSNSEKAQRLMELSKMTELRQNEEAFDSRIQELNRDGAYKYLMKLNGILRGVGRPERGVRNNVRVGEHMAPSRQVQGAILNDTTEALKGIKDNHYRATLSYYTVNNLHFLLMVTEELQERYMKYLIIRISIYIVKTLFTRQIRRMNLAGMENLKESTASSPP